MGTTKRKILCIDDEEMLRMNFEDYLEDAGYQVYTAENGKVGLETFRKKSPDILLLDLRMPELGGLEVLAKVRQEAPETPVIVISGTGVLQDVVEALRLGAWDYITKPIADMAILDHSIEKCFERAGFIRKNREYKEELERTVRQRTDALRQLEEALDTMTRTQERLIQSEKLAVLGRLVASIAHEINTPLGVGVTAASHLVFKTKELQKQYGRHTMTRSDLEAYLKVADESSAMILSNLYRAADLIKSFKQVAVHQSSEERRDFVLYDYIHDILLSLKPKFRNTKYQVDVDCPEDLRILNYPGVFSQILTNFVMNSLLHGFEERGYGNIRLEVFVENETLHLRYSDDGKGIANEHLGKIFHPFFTTSATQSGSGLGMFIVYNLVTQKLHGSIHCKSEPGKGVIFYLDMPKNAPEITNPICERPSF